MINRLIYLNLDGTGYKLKTVSEFLPNPTEQDYINKSFVRYFLKHVTKQNIIEVTKENYENSDVVFYEKHSLEWYISGPKNNIVKNNVIQNNGVYEKNKKTIIESEKVFSGISKKINNYLQFYK